MAQVEQHGKGRPWEMSRNGRLLQVSGDLPVDKTRPPGSLQPVQRVKGGTWVPGGGRGSFVWGVDRHKLECSVATTSQQAERSMHREVCLHSLS